MIEIDGILISESLIENRFVCNLKACKGACCWEGDYGAPVSKGEIDAIQSNHDIILPLLPDRSVEKINREGGFTFYEDAQDWGTSCHEDGACVYLAFDELGVAKCSIETAYKSGQSTTNKPMSCHLYPLRVTKYEEQGFEAWNYEEWDICKAACSLGAELNIPVYEFVKDAIVRYKGEEFYERLKDAARYVEGKDM